MIINITHYRIVWSNKGETYGAIDVRDNNRNQYRLRSDNPQTLMFWANTLRNERPIFLNTESEVLYTGSEPLGEGE